MSRDTSTGADRRLVAEILNDLDQEGGAQMAWTWKYEPETPEAENPGDFPSQSDAESWLGEAWRTLAEAGVAGVSLEHDGEHVYGPMPLEE